jgi:hypothetical protein
MSQHNNTPPLEQNSSSGSMLDPGAGPQQPAPDPGRDSRGRFTRANKGGPGNPFARQVAQMRKIMLECVSEDELRAVVNRLLEKAKEGDVAAARLVLSYTVGKPAPVVDPDRLDIEEFELYRQEACPNEEFLKPFTTMPAGLACDILRALLPALTEDYRRIGARMFTEQGAEEHQQGQPELEQPGAANDGPSSDTSDSGEGRGAGCERETASPRRSQRRKVKPAKEPASQDTGTQPAPGPSPELPSVAQLLSFLPILLHANQTGAGPGEGGTVSKPSETARRAANPGP